MSIVTITLLLLLQSIISVSFAFITSVFCDSTGGNYKDRLNQGRIYGIKSWGLDDTERITSFQWESDAQTTFDSIGWSTPTTNCGAISLAEDDYIYGYRVVCDCCAVEGIIFYAFKSGPYPCMCSTGCAYTSDTGIQYENGHYIAGFEFRYGQYLDGISFQFEPLPFPTPNPTKAPTGSINAIVWGRTEQANYEPVECLANTATTDYSGNTIGVQCCANDGSTGSRPGCIEAVTFNAAYSHCKSESQRLCTRTEIETGIGATTGCGFDSNHVWSSTECQSISPSQAQTNNPTPSPTFNPTPSPTLNPTPSPTFNPTQSPTLNPTPFPTSNPTTVNPTKSPTDNPTKYPTKAPTKYPTKAPTKYPTKSPTDNPTPAPTQNPTASPTTNPTPSPTQQPTALPTDNPIQPGSATQSPTNLSISPTKYPTKAPSTNPTELTTSPTTRAPTIKLQIYPTPSPLNDGMAGAETTGDFEEKQVNDGPLHFLNIPLEIQYAIIGSILIIVLATIIACTICFVSRSKKQRMETDVIQMEKMTSVSTVTKGEPNGIDENTAGGGDKNKESKPLTGQKQQIQSSNILVVKALSSSEDYDMNMKQFNDSDSDEQVEEMYDENRKGITSGGVNTTDKEGNNLYAKEDKSESDEEMYNNKDNTKQSTKGHV